MRLRIDTMIQNTIRPHVFSTSKVELKEFKIRYHTKKSDQFYIYITIVLLNVFLFSELSVEK